MKLFSFPRLTLALAAAFAFIRLAPATEQEHDALIALAKDVEADFDSALQEAKEQGMEDALLLEAELIRNLVTSNLQGMMELLPRIDGVGEGFRYGIDRDFYSAEQLEGFADTLRCVAAYQQDDLDTFERYAVLSYQKSPGFNVAFGIGELLSRKRMVDAQELAMADFRVPMDLVLANVEGESRPLSEWLGDREAMLVDFWASWCGPCIRLMPKLKEKEEALSAQGIFVAGINTDRSDQLNNALKVREREGMESVPWLLDANGGDLSDMLMVDSIPRMVLIDREGKVLFNGHPMDSTLETALAGIGVELEH